MILLALPALFIAVSFWSSYFDGLYYDAFAGE